MQKLRQTKDLKLPKCPCGLIAEAWNQQYTCKYTVIKQVFVGWF